MHRRYHSTADKKAGIDIEKPMKVRRVLERALPGEELYEFVPRAGLAPGLVPATGAGTPVSSKMRQAFR